MTAEQLLEDQKQVFRDFPTEKITVSGVEYDCLVLSFVESRSLDDQGGGFIEQPHLVVAAERSQFEGSDLPIKGAQATFRGVNYRVFDVDEGDTAASVRLSLHRDVDSQ